MSVPTNQSHFLHFIYNTALIGHSGFIFIVLQEEDRQEENMVKRQEDSHLLADGFRDQIFGKLGMQKKS